MGSGSLTAAFVSLCRHVSRGARNRFSHLLLLDALPWRRSSGSTCIPSFSVFDARRATIVPIDLHQPYSWTSIKSVKVDPKMLASG